MEDVCVLIPRCALDWCAEQAEDATGSSGRGVLGKKGDQLRLKPCCDSLLLGLQQTALLGEGLLAHKGGKLFKGKQGLVKPFDGKLPEDLLTVPHDKDLLVRINT